MTDEADRLFNLRLLEFANDIPVEAANRAHSGTSFTPESRGEQERNGYARSLASDLRALEKLADTEEKKSQLVEDFVRYRAGLRERTLTMLAAKARTMSTMITGGSNFPVRSQRKKSDAADRKTTELIEFRERAMTAIRRTLQPELRPIMSGDDDAVERMRAKLVEAETLQTKMTATNAAIRKHAKQGPEAQVAALQALGHHERIARALLEPDDFKRIGYASYMLTNNNANIRRMRERLEQLQAAKSTEATEIQGEHARFEDCPAENRVRLFYPGKPSAEARASLKSAGFRWTPSLECWQAYRNPRSIDIARRKAGIPAAPAANPEQAQQDPA